jgi:hypothetical protein
MKKNNKNIFRRYTIKVSIRYPDKLVAYLILIIRKVLTVELLMKKSELSMTLYASKKLNKSANIYD